MTADLLDDKKKQLQAVNDTISIVLKSGQDNTLTTASGVTTSIRYPSLSVLLKQKKHLEEEILAIERALNQSSATVSNRVCRLV